MTASRKDMMNALNMGVAAGAGFLAGWLAQWLYVNVLGLGAAVINPASAAAAGVSAAINPIFAIAMLLLLNGAAVMIVDYALGGLLSKSAGAMGMFNMGLLVTQLDDFQAWGRQVMNTELLGGEPLVDGKATRGPVVSTAGLSTSLPQPASAQ